MVIIKDALPDVAEVVTQRQESGQQYDIGRVQDISRNAWHVSSRELGVPTVPTVEFQVRRPAKRGGTRTESKLQYKVPPCW